MNNKIAWTLFTILLITFSCSDKYESETLVFNKYLVDTFGVEIPDSKHTYLVESTFQCIGCVVKTYYAMLDHVNQDTPNSFTIITFDSNQVPNELKNRITVLEDKTAKYESLEITFANITIVQTKTNRIKSINSIQLPEIDSTIQKLFQ
jgi:hypothetical protein